MSLFGAIVVFVIAWWLIFFMALPFGARPPDEPGEGHAASAPERPRLLLKAAVTTVLAALVTAGLAYLVASGLLDWRPEKPLMPEVGGDVVPARPVSLEDTDTGGAIRSACVERGLVAPCRRALAHSVMKRSSAPQQYTGVARAQTSVLISRCSPSIVSSAVGDAGVASSTAGASPVASTIVTLTLPGGNCVVR